MIQFAGATVVVVKSKLYGNRLCYSAWEPSSLMGPYYTICHIDGVCYGQIGTRILEGADHLPGGSEERRLALLEHRERQAGRARDAIETAYPEAAAGQPAIGLRYEVEVQL